MAPSVRFSVRAPSTRPGQAVVLVGSAPPVGAWAPAAGAALTTDAATFPVWRSGALDVGDLALPLTYKYVVAPDGGAGGDVAWEVDGRSAVRTLTAADVGADGGEVRIDDGTFGVLRRPGRGPPAAMNGAPANGGGGGGGGVDPTHGGGPVGLTLTERPLDALEAAIVAMNADRRSWRRRLSYIRELFCGDGAAAGLLDATDVAHLATVVVYLTFLTTGQVRCEEDGGHHRPNHHAAEAKAIDAALAAVDPGAAAAAATAAADGAAAAADADAAADDGLRVFLLRKIYPLLPSYAPHFTVAVPMTRIRNIAHRGDIPHDLKQQIKHTLQNKLHRCAGPEDLATCERLLAQVTAPGTAYAGAFIDELRVFREELREFFNATALDDRLRGLAADGAATAGRLLGLKHGWAPATEQLTAVNGLRAELGAAPPPAGSAAAQAARLADVELEKYAVTLLAAAAADAEGGVRWDTALAALAAAATGLHLSRVTAPVAEAAAVAAELSALSDLATPTAPPPLLRVRAAVERAVRLVDALSGALTRVYADRVAPLAAALGVDGPAATVFAEAEVRAAATFHMARLASAVARDVRTALALPPWDALCPGTASGVLAVVDDLGAVADRPADGAAVVALVTHSTGEEDVPACVRAVVLGHDLPHLSHLAVRARQAGVVLVCADEAAAFRALRADAAARVGARVTLAVDAGARRVELTAAPDGEAPAAGGKGTAAGAAAAAGVATAAAAAAPAVPVEIGDVDASVTRVLRAADVTPATGGAKASAAGTLERLAADGGAFATPTSVVVPFGVFLAAADAAAGGAGAAATSLATLAAAYGAAAAGADAAAAADAARGWIEASTTVPPAVVAALQSPFPAGASLMVRSSANCEDLESMSGAGLYDSLAAVPAADDAAVAAAVRRVWGSLWTARAASSRAAAGVPHGRAAMAVLVQAMVPADVAFIAFSRNPVAPAAASADAAAAYMELAVGMGETLASAGARGTPYRASVGRDGAVAEAALASYSAALVPAAAAAADAAGRGGGGGLVRSVLDYSTVRLTTDAAYRTAVFRRVGGVVAALEAALGAPQDTEGVLDAAGELYVVQTRPMVVAAERG